MYRTPPLKLNDPLPPYQDPIVLGESVFARNARGLHVPVETLTVEQQCAAPLWQSIVDRAESPP